MKYMMVWGWSCKCFVVIMGIAYCDVFLCDVFSFMQFHISGNL